MEKICVWPNGIFCEMKELDSYLMFMSDDYEVVDEKDDSYSSHEIKDYPVAEY